jgi:F-type H+-transporting ATPase subunit b
LTPIVYILALDSPIHWWDYPGLEAWKFLNLFIFVAALLYFLHRPLSDAFRGRLESIRRELTEAKEERDRALEKLALVNARLANLDSEVEAIKQKGRNEAAEEAARIARDTDAQTLKLQDQLQREIERAGKAARQELRLFAADRSVRLAEELIRREIRSEDDLRLVNLSISRLRGSQN